jgi:hypothetical protein
VHDTTQSNVTEVQIKEVCEKYANLLGCLDRLFSHICGVNEGLLPIGGADWLVGTNSWKNSKVVDGVWADNIATRVASHL